jgi:hypothetical protein
MRKPRISIVPNRQRPATGGKVGGHEQDELFPFAKTPEPPSRDTGIAPTTLRYRLDHGSPVEKALSKGAICLLDCRGYGWWGCNKSLATTNKDATILYVSAIY